jgi:hypothetical protein
LTHYTSDSDVAGGRTYKTWQSFPHVSPQEAYARAYAFTIEHGFAVTSADREAGVISASQQVSYGRGKTVPLGIVVRPDGRGSKVSIAYATAGGLMSPEDAVKTHFCKTMSAVGMR